MSAADLLAAWVDATAAGRLTFPRCAACGAWNWYPLPACRSCGGFDMQPHEVPPRGVIDSWTRVHRAFGTPPVALPYVTVLVAVEAAPGVRLVCLMDGTDSPVIGAKVALRPGTDEKGKGGWLCHLTA